MKLYIDKAWRKYLLWDLLKALIVLADEISRGRFDQKWGPTFRKLFLTFSILHTKHRRRSQKWLMHVVISKGCHLRSVKRQCHCLRGLWCSSVTASVISQKLMRSGTGNTCIPHKARALENMYSFCPWSSLCLSGEHVFLLPMKFCLSVWRTCIPFAHEVLSVCLELDQGYIPVAASVSHCTRSSINIVARCKRI